MGFKDFFINLFFEDNKEVIAKIQNIIDQCNGYMNSIILSIDLVSVQIQSKPKLYKKLLNTYQLELSTEDLSELTRRANETQYALTLMEKGKRRNVKFTVSIDEYYKGYYIVIKANSMYSMEDYEMLGIEAEWPMEDFYRVKNMMSSEEAEETIETPPSPSFYAEEEVATTSITDEIPVEEPHKRKVFILKGIDEEE